MQTYTGTKTLDAKPMTLGDYNEYQGWTIPADQNPNDEGYLVEYHDGGKKNHDNHKGYISWSPKDVFERTYSIKLEPYQQRVVREKSKLDERISNLVDFMACELFSGISDQEQDALTSQLTAMNIYSVVLGQRVDRF